MSVVGCMRLTCSEIIQDLANMVHKHLTVFQQNMKTLPQKIVMFRVGHSCNVSLTVQDGVSEGQYGHCVK